MDIKNTSINIIKNNPLGVVIGGSIGYLCINKYMYDKPIYCKIIVILASSIVASVTLSKIKSFNSKPNLEDIRYGNI
jgi:hypothetical protein